MKEKELMQLRKLLNPEPDCLDRLLYGKRVRLLYVLVLCVLIGLVIPYILAVVSLNVYEPETRGLCGLNISYRFECLPGETLNQTACHSVGCCYDPVNMGDLFAPTCFHSIPSEYGYTINNATEDLANASPVVVPLRTVYRLQEKTLSISLSSLRSTTPLGTDAWPLQMKLQTKGDNIVRIKIWNQEHDYNFDDFVEEAAPNPQFDVTVEERSGMAFNITVTRRETQETIFESMYGPMIYSEGYIEMTSRISTRYLYGLGQRDNFDFTPNFDQREKWSLFNREGVYSEGITYGSHPFYMNFERSGYMHGVYLKNSAPLEVGVLPIPAIVFRALDGIIDLRFFAGPTPAEVTNQYTGMVGRPALPPYWALGYHLCRTSSDPAEYERTATRMEDDELPYESDCIDARLNYPDTFSSLSPESVQKVQTMQEEGRKFLLVQYPFLLAEGNTYLKAEKYLLKLGTNTSYYGVVEGNVVAYPDFADVNTLSNWLQQDANTTHLYSMADGVLLFQNTPINDVILNYTSWQSPAPSEGCNASHPEHCCPPDSLRFHPILLSDLNNGTLCWATRHPSLQSSIHTQYHNQYGQYHHARITQLQQFLNDTVRPFVTSLSTFPGSGALGGHFGGSYTPDFVSQKKALLQVIEMGLYGVSMVGQPICGNVNTTDGEMRAEWCIRGHQMATFWPFMMSHYELGHTPRNPSDFDEGFSKQLKYTIRHRYMILPYLYTLLYEAHLSGTPVVRPLFYAFPDDPRSRNVASQFLVGDVLLISPALNSIGDTDSVQVDVYFPPGCWYDMYTGHLVANSRNGSDTSLSTLLTDINAHVRGGFILPMQGNLHDSINTTEDHRRNMSFHLVVGLSCVAPEPVSTTTPRPTSSSPGNNNNNNNTRNSETFPSTAEEVNAHGWLYLDDGVTPLDGINDPHADVLQFWASAGLLNMTKTSQGDGLCNTGYNTVINVVWIFGSPKVDEVTVDGILLEKNLDYTQDPDTYALFITTVGFDWCTKPSSIITWA